MDPLADLDLDVQGLARRLVAPAQHVVNSLVTGWLTPGTRLGDGKVLAHVPAGLARVVTADR